MIRKYILLLILPILVILAQDLEERKANNIQVIGKIIGEQKLNKEDISTVEEIEQKLNKKKEKEKLLQEEKERIAKLEEKKRGLTAEKTFKIDELLSAIYDIKNNLKDNILLKRYSNYIAYGKITGELTLLRKKLSLEKGYTKELKYQLQSKIKVKENELELIKEYSSSPIGSFINPTPIPAHIKITNPFGIINALSDIRKLQDNKLQFKSLEQDLDILTQELDKELVLYLKIFNIDQNQRYKKEITFLDKQVKDFSMVLEIVNTTEEVYTRKIDQVILEIKDQISQQIKKTILILVVIFILFVISFLIKLALKKYFSQNESYYMTNKIINFTVVFFIILILLFSYIDNVSYIVTILGFASAGIAIALKDWFMSIFGWMVIVTSGSIQVGDRIMVQRNGVETVGDVLDISLFKITIREDVTYIAYTVNRRTGRIFFIPNNYVFSEMISNFTHAGLRTVWDGIDITLTFDSNHKKAQKIVRNIMKKYSKGYTDITRQQLSKLRSKYQLRSTGVDPRVFTFIEPYGMVISGWYLTNSYSALQLRSTMSPEIIEAFLKEDDIHIAYPTSQININKTNNPYGPSARRKKPQDLEEAKEIF